MPAPAGARRWLTQSGSAFYTTRLRDGIQRGEFARPEWPLQRLARDSCARTQSFSCAGLLQYGLRGGEEHQDSSTTPILGGRITPCRTGPTVRLATWSSPRPAFWAQHYKRMFLPA